MSKVQINIKAADIHAARDAARQFSVKERKKLAGKAALPDGSFPIQTVQDLKNAIQAFGRAKNKARAKAHIIRRAKALKATNLLPADWAHYEGGDVTHIHGQVTCPETGCDRKFLDEAALADHAEAVHTFSDIERAVSEAVREKFGVDNGPSLPRIYAWVNDIAEDWVVFTIEAANQCDLMKASYVFNESTGLVTIGDPVEVVRKTVYEPVKKD